ncbi:MAG: SPOR domain-containing protein [Nitrospinales bacterium]
MTFHLKFSSVLLGLAFSGILIYSSEDFDSSFLDKLSPEKTRAVKPTEPEFSAANSLEKPRSLPPVEFTFFETLSDAGLGKYAGLDGTIEGYDVSAENLEWLEAEWKKGKEPPLKNFRRAEEKKIAALEAGNSPRFPNAPKIPHSPPPRKTVAEKSGGRVWAGSFKEFDHAVSLLKKLRKNGRPASISAHVDGDNKEMWYRVYLENYSDRAETLEAVNKARVAEGLTPISVSKQE